MNDAMIRALNACGLDPKGFQESPYCPGVLEIPVAGGQTAIDLWQSLRDVYGETGYWPILRGEILRTEAPEIMNAPSPPPVDVSMILKEIPKGSVLAVLRAHFEEKHKALNEWLTAQGRLLIQDVEEDPLDSSEDERIPWPNEPVSEGDNTLATPYDFSGPPLAQCGLALVPCREPADAPAHLGFGGWNSCPPPNIQVAVCREWARRFGAAPAAISNDVMECIVDRPPQNEAEAMALAEEQFQFCNDIVSQGTHSLRALAINLWQSNKWFFWWD